MSGIKNFFTPTIVLRLTETVQKVQELLREMDKHTLPGVINGVNSATKALSNLPNDLQLTKLRSDVEGMLLSVKAITDKGEALPKEVDKIVFSIHQILNTHRKQSERCIETRGNLLYS